jgi:lanosterol synthase
VREFEHLFFAQELYIEPYHSINWPRQRNNVATVDLYTPHPFILDVMFKALSTYEHYLLPYVPGLSYLRKAGMKRAYDLVVMDDENTSYQDLAPVNKVLNIICRYAAEGRDSEAMRLHKAKIRDFLWMSPEGMMACGTNGSRAFLLLALAVLDKSYRALGLRFHWSSACGERSSFRRRKQGERRKGS